jgi:hypothetical protein
MSLLKDTGYSAVCQTDINALIPMMALSFFGRRSVFMGNPDFYVNKDLFRIWHDVPGIKMKGFDSEILPFEIRNFTVGGWGATIRYDFSRDKDQVVTIARANPGQSRILLTKGHILEGGGVDRIGCSLSVTVKHENVLQFFRKAADYGGHFVMAYGDYIHDIQALGRMMKFETDVV